MKKRTPIIAVDFDGTLVEHMYPKIGKTKKKTLEFILKAQEKGAKIILYTCRGGKYLDEAIKWCEDNGIKLTAVNDDIPSVKESEFGITKSKGKIYANIYLDDRAVNVKNISKLYKEI